MKGVCPAQSVLLREVIDWYCIFKFIKDNTERNTGDYSKAGGLLATAGGKALTYRLVAEPSLMIDSNAPSQEYYPRHNNVSLAWQQTDK